MRKILICLSLIATPTAVCAADGKTDVLVKAVAARRSLPSQYRVELTRTFTLSAGVKSQSQITEITVWSKKDSLRTDVVKKSSSADPDGVGWREITCRNCERPGYGVRTRAGRSISLAVVDLSRMDAEFDRLDQWRVDWRGLGLLPGGLDDYARKPYANAIDLLASRASDVVARKSLNGFPCLVLTSSPQGDVRLTRTCWFRPDLGMNPVLWEDEVLASDFKRRTEIEYRQFASLGTWYPSSIHHTETRAGETVIDENLTIRLADFGTPVSDNVFTLAGLRLDNHQPVALPETPQVKDYPVWKDGKLDKTYTAGKMAAEAHDFLINESDKAPPQPDHAPPRWPYYLGSVVIAFFGLILLLFARKARRPDPALR